MGCDDQKPYSKPRPAPCKPACKEVRIVSAAFVEKTRVECVRCGLNHEFTLVHIDGEWKIRVKQ